MDKLTYTVDEVAGLLGISRTTAYECVRRGEIPALRLGRRLVITRTSIDRLLEPPAATTTQHAPATPLTEHVPRLNRPARQTLEMSVTDLPVPQAEPADDNKAGRS